MRSDTITVITKARQRQFLLLFFSIFILVAAMLSSFIFLTEEHTQQREVLVRPHGK